MASSLPTKADLEFMRSHLECPICLEIPRDGVMLQCINGHNVCATCKERLNDNRCPHGRCRFNNPPTRNRIAAGLISSLPFEFPCKHSAPGCEFKGTEDALKQHEIACDHRPIPCPNCGVFVYASKIIEHFAETHEISAEVLLDPAVIEDAFLWEQEYNSSSGCATWNVGPYQADVGYVFPGASKHHGQLYIWLQMLADISVTAKLKCKITLSKDDHVMSFTVPVYPIDWTQEDIMEDKDCACLSVWSIQKVLIEDLDEDLMTDGYYARFKVTFKIVKNSD